MGVKAVEILKDYKHKKQRVEMIQSQLDYLEIPKVKISKITDEIPGARADIYDQYEKRLQKKEEMRMTQLALNLEVSAVEKALELMDIEMPAERKAIELRHIENRSVSYIEFEVGASRRTAIRMIQAGEKEFERLMGLVI